MVVDGQSLQLLSVGSVVFDHVDEEPQPLWRTGQ